MRSGEGLYSRNWPHKSSGVRTRGRTIAEIAIENSYVNSKQISGVGVVADLMIGDIFKQKGEAAGNGDWQQHDVHAQC